MLFVYHYPCLDGMAAAAVALKHSEPLPHFISYNLARPPLGDIRSSAKDKKVVFFMDCAPPYEFYKELVGGVRVVILDHHIGNMRGYPEGLVDVTFDMTKSGCQLAWDYFFPGETIPPLLQIIGERDLGAIEKHKNVGAALVNRDINVPSDMLCLIEGGSTTVEELEKQGISLREKIDAIKLNPVFGKQGPNVVALMEVRTYKYISELGVRMLKEFPHVNYACFWRRVPEGVNLSFRTERDDVDLSLVAKELGGGGHKRAAGATATIEKMHEFFGIL